MRQRGAVGACLPGVPSSHRARAEPQGSGASTDGHSLEASLCGEALASSAFLPGPPCPSCQGEIRNHQEAPRSGQVPPGRGTGLIPGSAPLSLLLPEPTFLLVQGESCPSS